MEHPLDNPVWNALNTGSSNLANGSEHVKYFDRGVAPFVGLRDFSADSFDMLYQLIAGQRVLAVVSASEIAIPEQWKVITNMKILQLVFEGALPDDLPRGNFIALTEQHIPQMLALTKLTNPGPFAERTIEFGNYNGVFDDDKLVAMAGYRMQPSPYTELSAVCTHPGHLGNGYAGKLINHHIRQIILAAGIPFLHVRPDNENALRLYQKLGFAIRKEMIFNVIRKN